MKYDIFTTCQFAADYGGKLSIIGAYDIFHAKNVPARMAAFFVVFRLHFGADEHGMHTFQLSILDSDGTPIMSTIKDGFDLAPRDNSPGFMVTKLFNLNGIPIPQFGEYRVSLEVDDTPLIDRVVTLLPEP